MLIWTSVLKLKLLVPNLFPIFCFCPKKIIVLKKNFVLEGRDFAEMLIVSFVVLELKTNSLSDSVCLGKGGHKLCPLKCLMWNGHFVACVEKLRALASKQTPSQIPHQLLFIILDFMLRLLFYFRLNFFTKCVNMGNRKQFCWQ